MKEEYNGDLNFEKKDKPIANLPKVDYSSPAYIQVYDIVTGKDPSWHSIIYELVRTEQLNPWDIDINLLCKSYFEKIREMEDNNFFISSKILLAAALLLRIKSEILLKKYIKEIDNVLFNKNDEINKIIENIIEIDEDELPILSPKTPLPRFKKVTLNELITALDTAIKTESRRIQKELQKKQAERLSYVDIPKFRRINIRDRIRHFYARILTSFKNKKGEIKLPYSYFTNNQKEEKITYFLPMLHLSNTNKIWLEQNKHYDEIYLYLYEIYKKNFPDKELEYLKEEIEEEIMEDIEKLRMIGDNKRMERIEEINKDFENPLANLVEESV